MWFVCMSCVCVFVWVCEFKYQNTDNCEYQLLPLLVDDEGWHVDLYDTEFTP